MTFHRKLLLGVSLMVVPALVIGAEAIRSNALERRALETLGDRLGRSRTYAELETAMFNQGEVIWRHLSGFDPSARREYRLSGQVVEYWFGRWEEEVGREQGELISAARDLQRQFQALGDSVFHLTDAGRRQAAWQLADRELKSRLQPALTVLNREVYRRNRETSVGAAFLRVEEIVDGERRILVAVLVATLAAGIGAAWVLARSLTTPLNRLRAAMARVATGDLAQPVTVTSHDEIGELARAFASMTESLRQSRSELVRLNDELGAKIRQLEHTQAQLVQSEKLASIGEMAAAVAHGLRNPLASLRASAQLVLRHPGSPAAGEQLRAIVEEVDRLDRRISHLLTFSRPAPFRPVPERLVALVHSVLPAFQDRVRAQGVRLELDLPQDLPEAPLDRMKLEQVLVELLANALDAMPDGGMLRIAGSPAPNSGGGPAGVRLTVADTGRGITPEALQQVGQPFFTTRPEGTGLGLATARRFVEQHGGRLELTSTPGAGTTVVIWLPLEWPASAGAAR